MPALSQTRAMLTSSEACERNKGPILAVLAQELAHATRVLEIGSGNGTHALHFAAHLPHLSWQPTELPENLPALTARLAQAGLANLAAPLPLDARDRPWQLPAVDAVFSANTLHIMGWPAVEDFFHGVGTVLSPHGVLCVYGPFRFAGAYTSASNADFDRWLQGRDPASGVRDFEALDALARAQQLQCSADHDMPANNRTLIWRRSAKAPA
jgi:cyclopropane fatty-acyl-phospholipid synthase-like methyltransferase